METKKSKIQTRFSDMEKSGQRTEWICDHGIGHHMGVHGCDGCCTNEPETEAKIEHCSEIDCPECQRALLDKELKKIIKRIEALKEATQRQTGAFKYDVCYEECIDLINNIKRE